MIPIRSTGTIKPPLGSLVNPAHPLAAGLVTFLMFREGSGYTTFDSSGNGNHGILTNMVAETDWVPTPYGPGLDFDAYADRVVCTNDMFRVPAVTVWAWVIPRGAVPYGCYCHQVPTYRLWQSNLGLFSANIRAGGTETNLNSSTTVASRVGIPTQVACTYDGQFMCVYVDGVLGAAPLAKTGAFSYSSSVCSFGGTAEFPVRTINGVMVAAGLWSRALSATEIGSLQSAPWDLVAPRWLFYVAAGGGTAYDKTLSDALSVSDTTARALARSLSDAIGGADAISRVLTRSLTDACGAGDTILRASARALSEAMGVADAYTRATGRTLVDAAGMPDTIARGASRIVAETIGAADLASRGLGRTITVTVGTADAYARALTLARTYTDSVSVLDAYSTDYTAEVTGLRDIIVLIDTRGTLILTDLRSILNLQ